LAQFNYDRLIGIISKTDILNIAKERLEYSGSFEKGTSEALQNEKIGQRVWRSSLRY
jgi:hypothetical protein